MIERAAVLVVDDEEDVRNLVARLLESAGYKVHATGDPQEALWLARSERLDLIVSDVTMPVLDGFALLRALQQNPATAQLPVLFLTARSEFDDRVRAFRFGAVDFVAKPFSREGLLLRVARALERCEADRGRVQRDGPGAAQELLDEAPRESRSGVQSAAGEDGPARVVLRAGEVIEHSGALPAQGPAEFEEQDAHSAQIVAQGAAATPPAPPLPEFDDVPAALRAVLVVDDDELFRRFLTTLLRGRGFAVYEARNGLEALAVALDRRPWLILSDVNMPEMDGLELCRRIRRHALVRHTPLVFVSGWDDYKDRYRGLSAGADEFLSKTTPVRELLIRVQLVLRRYVDLGGDDEGHALRGEIGVIGAAGLLQMGHLGRWSGTLHARGRGGRFEARLRAGELISAESAARTGALAVYDFLAWNEGQFTFMPGEFEPSAASLGESFDALLLEGCRLLDEAQRR